MKNKFIILVFTAVSLFTSGAQAAYLTESHLSNDTFATAQFIDSVYFDSNFDRDINTGTGVNISTSSLHASLLGSGDDTVDYFSFNAVAGQAYFDIDYGMDFGGSFDSWVELYDSSFNMLTMNDDYNIESGSLHHYDSFIDYNLTAADTYYIAVGRFSGLAAIPFGSNYTLHVTQNSLSAVPVPAAIWLFLSGVLAIFGFASGRKSK
ncbi:MAG: hypothetical protein DIZ80_05130 [endosymbiont of Galathealinum brachiosum]|uniref:Uncharacterized protein n=1 Tax=endosymbiont of Galathealinum brachiosum TaxID=2200906 RepID=A0A370DIU3_9GAMM|nr:MAG: hypothetical protein DIZ80_05130 [endosymbiont of Galathealinum brachiosum]